MVGHVQLKYNSIVFISSLEYERNYLAKDTGSFIRAHVD